MTGLEFNIRTARPIELPYAIEIDSAAFELFGPMGLLVELADDHPFVVEERERWRRAAKHGALYFATVGDKPVGFAALGRSDGHAELEQLAVFPEYGRRGIGRALIEHVCAVCLARGETELWLTTYAHVPWNRPYYEQARFALVPESDCGPQVRATLAAQRAILRAPDQRIAMRRRLS